MRSVYVPHRAPDTSSLSSRSQRALEIATFRITSFLPQSASWSHKVYPVHARIPMPESAIRAIPRSSNVPVVSWRRLLIPPCYIYFASFFFAYPSPLAIGSGCFLIVHPVPHISPLQYPAPIPAQKSFSVDLQLFRRNQVGRSSLLAGIGTRLGIDLRRYCTD
jgi:hypothetical protein